MKLHAFMAVLFILLVSAGSAVAQTTDQREDKNRHYLYEWKDTTGTVHITDNLGDVPEQYRRQVRKRLEQPAKEETGRQEQVTPQPATQLEEEADQEAKKEEWQLKIREWKERLNDAEKRYRVIEDERNKVIMRWGVPANAPPEYRTRAIELEAEIKTTQKEIDDARNMIDVVIPDEARKAGIPPGWLRE
jgi:hypothetical protein